MQAIDSDWYEKAKEAVIEKWITLCKNLYLDEVMQWRLKMIALRLNHEESQHFKNSIIKLRYEEFKTKYLVDKNE